MKIAILSGKGGVGKTFASVNLAITAARLLGEAAASGEALAFDAVRYIDCDAEAPNGALFLANDEQSVDKRPVTVRVPSFDRDACTGCRACTQFCAFGALAYIGESPLLFDEICHGCGGCAMVCPAGAVSEKDRVVGVVERTRRGGLDVIGGRMNVGESSSMPIVRQLLAEADDPTCLSLVDCPPGTACSAAECVKEADYCLIVAEPSDFGVHNLRMAHDLVAFFEKPCGVLINKAFEPDNAAARFCGERGIDVVASIPFDRALAMKLARAGIVVEDDASLREAFERILRDLVRRGAQAGKGAVR